MSKTAELKDPNDNLLWVKLQLYKNIWSKLTNKNLAVSYLSKEQIEVGIDTHHTCKQINYTEESKLKPNGSVWWEVSRQVSSQLWEAEEEKEKHLHYTGEGDYEVQPVK